MDDIKRIMEQYEQYNKELKMQELKNERYDEEIEKANQELNSPEDKQYNVKEVISEYEKLKTENAKEIENTKQSKEAMKSEENRKIVAEKIQEVTAELEAKKAELEKSHTDLLDFYTKENKEGKIVEDFYREQRNIETSIKKLENEKNQYEEFFNYIKSNEQIIEEANPIILQYEQDNKRLKIAQLKNEKYDEEIKKAKEELNSSENKEYDVEEVIKEYQKLKDENAKEIENIETSINSINSEKNVQTITNSIDKIEVEIENKKAELAKSHKDLLEFYGKENKEGKIVEDFYNEQRKIEASMKELENKKTKYQEFLDNITGRKNEEPVKPVEEPIKPEEEPIKLNEEPVEQNETQPVFDSIEISAHKGVATLNLDDGTTKEIPLDQVFELSEKWKKDPSLKNAIKDYCKENGIGFFKKFAMTRKMNPIILEAIEQNGTYDDLENYMDALTNREYYDEMLEENKEADRLGFPLDYDLTDSTLKDKQDLKMLNRYAKREIKYKDVTATGIEKSLFERIVDKIKNVKLFSKTEEPKAFPKEEKEKTHFDYRDIVDVKANKPNMKENLKVSEKTKERLRKIAESRNKEAEEQDKTTNLDQDER